MDDVGDHTTASSLINTLDGIRANAWTPFAEAFYNAIGYFARTSTGTSRTDLRLNTTDFDSALNPSQYRCQQNFVLLISDGSSTADRNENVTSLASLYSTAAGKPSGWDSTCPNYAGSKNLPIMSWLAKNRNISTFSTSTASTGAPVNGRDFITTYVVYNGGSNGLSGECNSLQLLTDTATKGGTTIKVASNPGELQAKLEEVLREVSAKTASGTAASILSNSEGSGANILQAVFYPKKIFDDDTSATWIGEMQNLWYYLDPFIGNSTVREDTTYISGDTHTLDLKQNYVVRFDFNNSTSQTEVKVYQDTNGDGLGELYLTTESPDDVKSIWRAGKQLWARDLSASPRTIYTPCISGGTCVSGTGLMKFSYGTPDNSGVLQSYLQAPTSAAAVKLMKYVHGFDFPGDATMRSRTVKIGNIPAAAVSTDTTDPYVTNPRDKGVGVWKLGDIITSTPRLESPVKANNYDLPPPAGYADTSYTAFTGTTAYQNRGMVYVGANDGMLHAFKLGLLNVTPSGTTKATLTGANLGREDWAFIPQNALPYLSYMADPDYAHLYYVDGSTTVLDAAIGGCSGADYWNCSKDTTHGSNWRTVLLSGSGVGGASRDSTDTCTDDASGTCVKTPISGVGYSSYFALDVTDQGNPQLMWEFSDASIADAANKGLGFATTNIATVKISARDAGNHTDNTKNGRWFAVFGSGPTGPIDKTKHRFLGTSNQPIKIYVVDLNATPPFVLGTNYWVIKTLADGSTIDNAFVSSMNSAAVDVDRWNKNAPGHYQDDVLYFGYVQKNSSIPAQWRNGGVLRLVTGHDPNPANWRLSKVVDGIGPVTAAFSRLQDRKNHKFWLYFGEGRYYYSQDDYNSIRRLYGVKEPCYRSDDTFDMACTTKATSFTNQTNADETSIADGGWYITLDAKDIPTTGYGAERVITDPVAMTNGAVFFTTFKPTSDPCNFGGSSYLWGVRYDTGLQAPTPALQGKALVQVSTGSFEEINLANAFTDKNNRRMADPMTGKPPSDPPPIISKSNLKPVKRIIHIQER